MKRVGCFGCLFRLFAVGTVLVLLAGGALLYLVNQPYKGFQQDVFLELEKGTGTPKLADDLAAAGIVRSKWAFLMVRAIRPRDRLQAGEYHFTNPASPWTVFDRIERGDVFYYELTVPEGCNIFDVAGIVNGLGFIEGEDFLKVARSPESIEDLAPGVPSLEGFLFPSTYRLTRRTSATQFAKMMTDEFRRHWKELQPPGEQLDAKKMVTLASVVEKETGLASDRTHVASVYANRLRQGMPLDADPTTIYAAMLQNRYHGVIHRSDLGNLSEYNTYKHAGLPPGPIANPGLASLKAAIHPADTQDLYFVAKPGGSGGSNFSRTLQEHNLRVQEYRRGKH